jgi:hypothetical protein
LQRELQADRRAHQRALCELRAKLTASTADFINRISPPVRNRAASKLNCKLRGSVLSSPVLPSVC